MMNKPLQSSEKRLDSLQENIEASMKHLGLAGIGILVDGKVISLDEYARLSSNEKDND